MTTIEGLLQEAAEDIQRERYAAFWQRWRGFIIGTVVALIAGTALFSAWNAWQYRARIERTGALMMALGKAETEPDAARNALNQFALDNGDKYEAALARLRSAELAAKNGNIIDAVALYDAIAQDKKTDVVIRDLASLLAVQAQIDTGDLDSLSARIEPMLNEGFSWRDNARELAMLVAIKKGDNVEALRLASLLTEDNKGISPSIAMRAKVLRNFLQNQ